MKTFVDRKGMTWEVEITTTQIKRVRDTIGLDLLAEGSIEKLTSDVITFVDFLFCLVKRHADANCIDDEEFARRLKGDAYKAAFDATLEELADFFPTSRRAALLRLGEKLNSLDAQIMARVDKMLDAPGPTDEQIDTLLRAGVTSTASPGSSGLTLAR